MSIKKIDGAGADMVTLKQLRSVVAVYEEGSFTLAAQRENATQSGVSQHVAAIEKSLGVTLFQREPDGVKPTLAGKRYYSHAIEILRHLDHAAGEAKTASKGLSGRVRAGLMPTFTRAAVAPVLERILSEFPDIEVQIVEGYSGTLTEMVRAESLDFALVPSSPAEVGLNVSHLVRDREMLVSAASGPLPHQAQVKLSALGPLNLIVPSRNNVRRGKLDEYFATHGVQVARLLEMDAMMATLELVARSDWVAVLPGLLCVNDHDGTVRHISPIGEPPIYSEFVMIEPTRKALSPQAQHLFATLKQEIEALATD